VLYHDIWQIHSILLAAGQTAIAHAHLLLEWLLDPAGDGSFSRVAADV
jgi:hypothetical protein